MHVHVLSNIILRVRIWMLSVSLFGGRTWYQFIEFSDGITTESYAGQKAFERTRSFEEWLRNFSDWEDRDVVLDLGSNAAWLSLCLAEKVARVKAVEIDSKFARQARFVTNYFRLKLDYAKKVSLFEGDISQHLDLLDDVTVILASKFLYHPNFSNGSVEGARTLMEKIMKSNVRMIIVQNHVTHDNLGDDASVSSLLGQYGFSYQSHRGGTEEYPIAVATRQAR